MNSTVLITGGAGFIGSHAADRFLAEGWDVHVVDNLTTGYLERVPAGATMHQLDVREAKAAALVGTLRPNCVLHLAAQMDVRKSVADPVFDAGVNIIASLALLEAVRLASHASRVVFASTGGVIYGDYTSPPNREDFAKNSDSPYAIAKLAVEHYLDYYGRIHGLDAVSLRYGNVYGPRQDPHGEAGVVAIFCGRLIRGEPLLIFGDGEQTRDYVYIDDVVDATFRAAVEPIPAQALANSRAFNVGTGIATTVLTVADLLKQAAGATDRSELEFHPHRPGEQQQSFLDPRKAEQELGWTAQVPLDEGMRRTWEWFVEAATTGARR